MVRDFENASILSGRLGVNLENNAISFYNFILNFSGNARVFLVHCAVFVSLIIHPRSVNFLFFIYFLNKLNVLHSAWGSSVHELELA